VLSFRDFQLPEFDKNSRKKNHHVELTIHDGSNREPKIEKHLLKILLSYLAYSQIWLNLFNESWPLWLQHKIDPPIYIYIYIFIYIYLKSK
jgi:hypothetical protein